MRLGEVHILAISG